MMRMVSCMVNVQAGKPSCCSPIESKRRKDLYRFIERDGLRATPDDPIMAVETRHGDIRLLGGYRRAAILFVLGRPIPYILRTFQEE